MPGRAPELRPCAPRKASKPRLSSFFITWCESCAPRIRRITLRRFSNRKGPDLLRDEAFEQYKANRTETPPDLLSQIPWIRKTLDALRIPVLEYPTALRSG